MDFQSLIHNYPLSPGVAAGLRSLIEDRCLESLDQIAEDLECDSLDEVWECFGDMRHCTSSNAPGELGHVLICQGAEQAEVALVIPFDVSFRLVGKAYLLVFDTEAKQEVQRLDLPASLSATLLHEAMEDIMSFAEDNAAGRITHDPLPPAGGALDYRSYVSRFS